jgi:drug/metabolite transporter (DMT)-like permease
LKISKQEDLAMTSLSAYHATEKGKFKAAACLVAATAIFGLGNVVQKAVLAEMDGWMSLGLRSGLALIVLAPWALAEFNRLGTQRGQLFRLLPLVMLGFTAGIGLQIAGSSLTSATNLGFLINLSVVFTPVLCWLSGQQKLDQRSILSCLVSLIGAALLSQGSPGNLGLGDLLCVGAAIGFAIWIIALQRAASQLKCPALLAFMQSILPMIIGFSMTEQSATSLSTLSSSAWMETTFLGFGASALAYLVAAHAQAKLCSVTAALIYPAEAVFGAVAAVIWLGETLSPLATFGACLTLVSIVIVSLPAGSNRFNSLRWRFA